MTKKKLSCRGEAARRFLSFHSFLKSILHQRLITKVVSCCLVFSWNRLQTSAYYCLTAAPETFLYQWYVVITCDMWNFESWGSTLLIGGKILKISKEVFRFDLLNIDEKDNLRWLAMLLLIGFSFLKLLKIVKFVNRNSWIKKNYNSWNSSRSHFVNPLRTGALAVRWCVYLSSFTRTVQQVDLSEFFIAFLRASAMLST